MKNVWKRTLSLFLAIVMILGNVPVQALATEDLSCGHANAIVTELTDASCGENGCAYWLCQDCNETWEEVIPAVGHAYESAEVDGMVVYTCGRCGDTYSEQAPVQELPAADALVQDPPVQEEPVVQEEAPAFFAMAPASRARTLNGVVWVNADANTEPMDLIGVAADGGIRDAVLRAIGWYDETNPNKYAVYCTFDGVTLNVANRTELLRNMDTANRLAQEMKNSVSQATTVLFDIKDASGSLVAIADVGFRSFKTLESADISLDITYEAKTAPEGLQATIENMVLAQTKVNGLTLAELAELPQCITVTVNPKTYVLPGIGQRDNVYSNIITATVTEGMTGIAATISGGTVTLHNSTPEYDVKYYASEKDWEDGNAYAEETQFEGFETPVPVTNPVREHYTFLGWQPIDNEGTMGDTGIAETVTAHVKYVAQWKAEQDDHTPGAVANNGVKDNIDDRDQSFVVTYYDSADEASRKVLFEVEVPYGTYLTHPSKEETIAKMAELEIINPGHAFKQWKHAAGQKGFIIKSNAAYVIEWKPVYTITYSNGFDGGTYEDLTQVLDKNAVIRHPAAPEREGWKFVSWVYTGEGNAPATATADATFEASWIKLHTIEFVDGKTSIKKVVLEDGAEIVRPAALADTETHAFGGWKLVSGTSDEVAVDDTVYEAVWIELHNVKFVDGEAVIKEEKLQHGANIVNPASPADTETHVFGGWKLVSGTSATKAESDTVLEAIWLQRFTITYTDGVADEEVFANVTRPVIEGKPINHPMVPARREGYLFAGWKAAEGSSDSLTAVENATFEATWVKKAETTVIYTITYTDGVEADLFADFSVEAVKDSAIIHPDVPAVLENHTFGGWVVTEGSDSDTAVRNVTYKATWNKLHHIQFVNGDNVIWEDYLEDGASFRHPAALKDTDTHAFGGWNLKSGTSTNTAVDDTVYEASWIKLHTITYTDGVEDAEVFADFTTKVKNGNLIKHPGIPAKYEGHVFDRWVLQSPERVEDETHADGDRTYKATWKKVVTITFTDGLGGTVFTDVTRDILEGEEIKYPVVPADREGYRFDTWQKVDDTTYQATWIKIAITITYIHSQPDGTEASSESHVDNGESDENAIPLEDSDNNKKIIVGWYPLVIHENEKCLMLVYGSAMARSMSRVEYVPVDGIHDYARKNALPAPVNPETYAFTEDITLYALELPDEDNNNVVDGQYELDEATGTAKKDQDGNLIPAEKSVSTIYIWEDYRGSQINRKPDYSQNGYNEGIALNPGVAHPDNDRDGIVFVKWALDRKVEGEFVSTYYIKGVVELDVNNNGIYDVNENAGIVIIVNEDETNPKEYENFTGNEITISLSTDVAGKKAPVLSNSSFLLDTQKGTNIEIDVDAAKGYAINRVEFNDAAATNIYAGDDDSIQRFKLADESANNDTVDTAGLPEYYVVIYLDKLETKASDLTFDPNKPLPEFSKQNIYESVLSYPKWDNSKNTVISYVARAAQEDVPVSIEPLFQWIKDNYGAAGEIMVGYIDSYLDTILDTAGMKGLVTKSNNIHYFHVKLEGKTKFVGDAISTPVKSAQDIANSHINAYINELVSLMKTSSTDTTALQTHLEDLPFMLAEIQDDANNNAMIRPFGYNADGAASFNESVEIAVDGKVAYTGDVLITDLRAPANLPANGTSVSAIYGTNAADGKLKAKAGINGVLVPVSYNGQAATTYPAGVVFPGSQTMRPASAVMNLTIARQTAIADVPSRVIKEHNEDYDQNPDPVAKVNGDVVGNVDIIGIIAGLDLTKMDINPHRNWTNPFTVENVNPRAWIKLPGNIRTHLALVESLDVDTSTYVEKMLEGKGLSAADTALVNKLLNEFLEKDQVSCTLDEAIHLMEVLAPGISGQKEAINTIKATFSGDILVTFTGDYPEMPGIFLNMGIIADANYVHGVNADQNTGKDYGLILNCPVLTMYNNGIQLVSDELPGIVHNVYTFESEGTPHALKVEGHEDAEIFYYGFNSGLAVHYDGDGKTPPARAGMYLVSAYVRDEADGKYKSDMAIMVIGVERTTTEVKGATIPYDGEPHKLEVITKDEEQEPVGRTIISGAIDKPDNAELSDLRGVINVDFPETIDNLWAYTVAGLEAKFAVDLPDTIQQAELTPEQTVEFLTMCKTKLDNKEFDGILGTVHTGLSMALDSLISGMNKIIGRTNGKVVTIQFVNDIGYDRHGVYLYHAIITDLVYIPSADSGILIIHAPEEDFQMEDQSKVYTGEGQLPDIIDETGREQFLVIYNQNTLSFVLGQDGNALLNKLEALGIKDGITVRDLLAKGTDKVSEEIMSGLITSGDKLLELIHKDDSELYQKAKDKLNAHVAAREKQIVAKLEAMLNDISEKVDPDTKLYFNDKPVDVGSYQVHAFSFGIAHEEAVFSIVNNVIDGDGVIAPVGKDLTYNGEAQELVTAGTYEHGTFMYSLEKNGTYTATIPTATDAGEYIVYYYIAGNIGYENSEVASVTATIKKADVVIAAHVDPETVTVGAQEKDVTITVKVEDQNGDEVFGSDLTDGTYIIKDAAGNTIEADKDEQGNVTKSALAKALETVGEYTIVPNAPADFTEDRIKTATLTVKAKYRNFFTTQVGLIEPWFLRVNLRITDQQKNTIDYSGITDYGAYFIRKEDLPDPNADRLTLTLDDIKNNPKSTSYTKGEEADVTESDNHAVFMSEVEGETVLSARFREGIYTYELSKKILYVFWYEDEAGVHQTKVMEDDISTLVNQRKDNATKFPNPLERDVYAKMAQMEVDILEYRKDKVPFDFPEQNLQTVAQANLGVPSGERPYSHYFSQQIILIEPWGIRLNDRLADRATKENIDLDTVTDYGIIMYNTATDTKPADAAEMLTKGNAAYVFSKSNGNIFMDDIENYPSRFSARYYKDIYTYMMDTNIYYCGYVVVGDTYYYGSVLEANLLDLVNQRANNNSYAANERSVYESMSALNASVTMYRNDYFANH